MSIAQGFVKAVFATVGAIVGEEADQKALQEKHQQLNRAEQRQRALAVDALSRGSFAAGQQRMQGSRVAAQQTVGYEASGVDSSTGTAAQVSDSTRMVAELDAASAMNSARREAMGHTEASGQLRDEWKAQVRAFRGRQTKRAMEVASSYLNFVAGAATPTRGADGESKYEWEK